MAQKNVKRKWRAKLCFRNGAENEKQKWRAKICFGNGAENGAENEKQKWRRKICFGNHSREVMLRSYSTKLYVEISVKELR